MEIRNNVQMNNTSFGMAFRKPSADKMQNFVEYVGKGVSGKKAKRALEVLQQQQAGNRHVDIEYVGNGSFRLVPTSQKAKSMGGEVLLPPELKVKTEMDKVEAKALKRIQAAKEAHGGKLPVVEKIRRTFIDIPRLIIAAVKDARNPLKVLPDNLQSAARRATHIEAKVDAQIAKENTIKSAFLLINSKKYM